MVVEVPLLLPKFVFGNGCVGGYSSVAILGFGTVGFLFCDLKDTAVFVEGRL